MDNLNILKQIKKAGLSMIIVGGNRADRMNLLQYLSDHNKVSKTCLYREKEIINLNENIDGALRNKVRTIVYPEIERKNFLKLINSTYPGSQILISIPDLNQLEYLFRLGMFSIEGYKRSSIKTLRSFKFIINIENFDVKHNQLKILDIFTLDIKEKELTINSITKDKLEDMISNLNEYRKVIRY